ncbi:MAG: hypothetical protein ACE5PT_15260 [Gemmatimonadales bacterium]
MSVRGVSLLIGAALIAACSDSSGPGTEPTASLSFSTRTPPPVTASAGPQFSIVAADTLSDSTNTLVISKVELVLREIELERVEVVDCDVDPEPEGCEEFEIGPILVDLPLNGATEQELAIAIPPGTYDELEFEIHKVSSGDPEDAAFRQAHPDFVDISIRVQGTFNGQAFTYETDLDVEQEFELNPPLVIDSTTVTTNVTVRVGLDGWFRDATGTLVDPASANKGGPNESLVKENIKQSFEAFAAEDQAGAER